MKQGCPNGKNSRVDNTQQQTGRKKGLLHIVTILILKLCAHACTHTHTHLKKLNSFANGTKILARISALYDKCWKLKTVPAKSGLSASRCTKLSAFPLNMCEDLRSSKGKCAKTKWKLSRHGLCMEKTLKLSQIIREGKQHWHLYIWGFGFVPIFQRKFSGISCLSSYAEA